MSTITLYGKPDCPLCDEVKHLLAALRDDLARRGEPAFTLDERNILAEPEDFGRFQYLIPVVDTGDALLYPPHDWLTLRTAILRAQRSHPSPARGNPA